MKMLAVDFSNLIIRHAANPYGSATDSLGRSIQGPFGAITQVMRTLCEPGGPTHLLIAQDSSRAESVRRDIAPTYKAHRPDADDDITRQFAVAYQLLELLRWPVVRVRGYEADDVIASVARIFPGRTEIVTGDKDLLALCRFANVRVVLLRPGGSLYCGRAQCQNIYGVPPEQVRDFKALVGDSSDGITGVPGIGRKTACRLLEAHGSLQKIYELLDRDPDADVLHVTRSVRRKLLEGRDCARISWRLAGLVDGLDVDVQTMQAPPPLNCDALAESFENADAAAVLEGLRKFQR